MYGHVMKDHKKDTYQGADLMFLTLMFFNFANT